MKLFLFRISSILFVFVDSPGNSQEKDVNQERCRNKRKCDIAFGNDSQDTQAAEGHTDEGNDDTDDGTAIERRLIGHDIVTGCKELIPFTDTK